MSLDKQKDVMVKRLTGQIELFESVPPDAERDRLLDVLRRSLELAQQTK